jgi:hypothetical protein
MEKSQPICRNVCRPGVATLGQRMADIVEVIADHNGFKQQMPDQLKRFMTQDDYAARIGQTNTELLRPPLEGFCTPLNTCLSLFTCGFYIVWVSSRRIDTQGTDLVKLWSTGNSKVEVSFSPLTVTARGGVGNQLQIHSYPRLMFRSK